MASLEDAITAIEGEWAYQDELRAAGKMDDPDDTLPKFLLLLEHYAEKARTNWCSFTGAPASLHEVRKIAALALRTMMKHGVVERGNVKSGLKAFNGNG